MSRILFAAKQSRTKLGMSRPVARFLQVTWWALLPMKRKIETFASNDKNYYSSSGKNYFLTRNCLVLFISVKPENVQLTLNDSSICQGDVFNISCSADGNPPVLTYLLFENDTFLNTSGSSLVTRTASAGGVLVYRCEANNTVGTANVTTTVTVNGKK